MVKRFNIHSERKESRKNVWDMIDSNDFEGVKIRVRGEVPTVWDIYNAVLFKIFRR